MIRRNDPLYRFLVSQNQPAANSTRHFGIRQNIPNSEKFGRPECVFSALQTFHVGTAPRRFNVSTNDEYNLGGYVSSRYLRP